MSIFYSPELCRNEDPHEGYPSVGDDYEDDYEDMMENLPEVRHGAAYASAFGLLDEHVQAALVFIRSLESGPWTPEGSGPWTPEGAALRILVAARKLAREILKEAGL